MAKIRKAQFGLEKKWQRKAEEAKKQYEASTNPKIYFPGWRMSAGSDFPVVRGIDTTGYAAGKKKFPYRSVDRTTTIGEKVTPHGASTTPRYGQAKRKYVGQVIKKMDKLKAEGKKKGGTVAKAQRGNRVCGPGGCRQTRGMVGFGGGYSANREARRAERQARRAERPGILKRIFAPNRKTGGSTKKK